jgi:hypothetical protein
LASDKKFGKSKLGHATELGAHEFVLLDRRFQKPPRPTKTRILELLDIKGDWTQNTFDLVMTSEPVPPLTEQNVATYLYDISLVEVKATKKAIKSCGLSGFFYGTTERQSFLAAAAGNRFRYAFVVLNSDNDYGRPFFCLLTARDVLQKIQSQRTQFQVNFKSKLADPQDPVIGPWPLADEPGVARPQSAKAKGTSAAGHAAKPIRDTITGMEYGSEARAGKALYQLVGGDIKDTFVWFKIQRAFPGRFETKNAEGEWVALTDPSARKGTTLPEP